MLIEAKKDLNFSSLSGKVREKQLEDRARVLSQVVYYYHKILEEEGLHNLPAVTVVADSDELFIVPSKILRKYLLEDYDWTLAPSRAWELNAELFEKLKNDKNVAGLYVYHLAEGFDFNTAAERLISVINNTEFSKIVISDSILSKAFEDFNKRVFGGSTVNTRLQASIFIQALLGSSEVYIHPLKPHVLVYGVRGKTGDISYKELVPSKELPLFLGAFQEFFEEYDAASYTLDEQKAITEIGDTLFDDFDRRYSGDFWTPAIWVSEAHKLIDGALNEYETRPVLDESGAPVLDENGEPVREVLKNIFGNPVLKEGTLDWKDRYIVWDAACGSKNLTRDYKFGEGRLFLSTLHDTELAISEDYNPEATSFQYDFLNDDIEIHELAVEGSLLRDQVLEYSDSFKIPESLFNALKNNEPIVFFMNPPYGQARNQDEANKTGIAESEVANKMRKEQMGHASSELYTQFIKRVQLFAETFDYDNDFRFFFFNKGFLTSPNFRRFTESLVTDFSFEDGFMLNAGEFNGTSSAWGIIFSHWALKPKTERLEANRQREFPFVVKESFISDKDGHSIRTIGNWSGKLVDKKDTISAFVPNQRQKPYNHDTPTTANGFTISKKGPKRGSMYQDSLGYIHSGSSNVQFSDKYTGWYSLCFNNGQGYPIAPDNFEKITVHFSVRKAWWQIIKDQNQLWIRDKDVFPAPSQAFQNSDKWGKFVADCVVYSLFASGSNQTSLRDYEYGENADGSPRKWDIENQFFWKSESFIKNLAEERDENHQNTLNFNQVIQKDLDRFGGERFVHKWLLEHDENISEDARNLLGTVDEILAESFKYRGEYARLYPKYQLETWDAGWEQVRRMVYGRDALPTAKSDPVLQDLKKFLKRS